MSTIAQCVNASVLNARKIHIISQNLKGKVDSRSAAVSNIICCLFSEVTILCAFSEFHNITVLTIY